MRGEIAIPRLDFRADPAANAVLLALVTVVAVMLASVFVYASAASSSSVIDAETEAAMVMPTMP